MPPQRSLRTSSSSAQRLSEKYKKPAKKLKPELGVEEKIQKRWRSVKDQITDGYLDNALRNVKKSEFMVRNIWRTMTSRIMLI